MSAKATTLRGGTVVDGTGAPPHLAEVVIEGDRIVSVGSTERTWNASKSDTIVDCTGCIIAPGFIDAHSHSDLQLLENRTEKLLQGVTTEVVGNCGFSAYPQSESPQVLRDFANGIFCGDNTWGWNSARDYLASAEKSRVATIISLVGHGALRIKVAGNTCRELTLRELDTMSGMLDEALEAGAMGLSSGLMYAPGSGASIDELTTLCRVVAHRKGVYATHMRNYSAQLVEAVAEQVSIAEASGCRLQISHLQAVGQTNWPLQERALAQIEQASARGIDIAFDAYPWLAGCTVLTQLLPQTALDGGISKLLQRLVDPVQRASIAADTEREHGSRWNDLFISSAANDAASLVGQSIQSIAATRGDRPAFVVLDILLEQQGQANILEYNQSTENLRTLLTHPLSLIVTDGVYTTGRPHPRLFGTFPLLLGEMVRERKWLSLEQAVHKISGKPAAVFHLANRGRISVGCVADLTVFDPTTVRTEATYEMPAAGPIGIKSVLRNGRVIVDEGSFVDDVFR